MQLFTDENGHYPYNLYKYVGDAVIVPHIGESIVKPLYEHGESRKVVNVEYDYEEENVFVYIKTFQTKMNEDQAAKAFKCHGWATNKEIIEIF